jgi:hypothetical protein
VGVRPLFCHDLFNNRSDIQSYTLTLEKCAVRVKRKEKQYLSIRSAVRIE